MFLSPPAVIGIVVLVKKALMSDFYVRKYILFETTVLVITGRLQTGQQSLTNAATIVNIQKAL